MEITPLLTVAEIGHFLQLKSETVYLLISKEGLPASKVGGQWRFDIEEVRVWFKQQRSTTHIKPSA